LEEPAFCENRMVVLQDPEVPPEELNQAIAMHLPLEKERLVSFKKAEVHPAVQEEEMQYMDLGTGASAYSGEAGRELASLCFTPEEEHLVQHYARVALPDIGQYGGRVAHWRWALKRWPSTLTTSRPRPRGWSGPSRSTGNTEPRGKCGCVQEKKINGAGMKKGLGRGESERRTDCAG
jgi:hypothetical protein